ncbi:MAG TPA: glucose-6-phosphate isomerase [Dehalococcoidia bacterium]|jgi:glucose-6-phosphate isomerase/transaldolase/glucose-6-phosphate isomerase|nr:glucose-6-phosphate isomerase [Dehalococcoidia bacterium]
MENQIGEALAGLGRYSQEVEAALTDLQRQEVVSRIWRKDHTVWKPEPREITNRLGWLDAPRLMGEQVAALNSFAGEIREAGFQHVVLLGMGGASLGAEVLRQTFGCAAGHPEFMVLDSTVPSWVRAVTEVIQPAHTLFLVSSKSGGTIETSLLYKYFRHLVEEAAGKEAAGRNFVAITDAGTPLARLAEEEMFRRVFFNPPDIGGRYSVLSYFGLVPAALMGIDLTSLLSRADGMCQRCVSEVSAAENPAAWLGATIGALGQRGRDKLTLITSPSISSFGLWLEQLIAESTGKEGKGILPVAGEPLVEPAHYGDDRLFIYLRLEGDDNAAIDGAIKRIKASGQPVVVLRLRDRYDLGAEFFRWELATAVVGAMLGINPFDQPNVQGAKDATKRVLEEYQTSGRLPAVETSGSLSDLLAQARPGDYFAVMAYVRQTPEIDGALTGLRRKVLERYHISTTAGYGPRLLHSTGQLHKGGPNSGLFFMVTADHEPDLPIPGEPYTFGVLADAQALGDLQTLCSLGRRVVRVHLGSADEASFGALAQELG